MLPSKLRSGQPFKASAVAKINEIIDYLKSQRLVSDNKTIKINQLSAGISISAIQNASVTQGATVSSFRHPFQLYLGTDENENQVLHIRRGRIALNGDDESRIYVCFEQNEDGFDESVPLPDTEGIYEVNLSVFYDENTQSANQDFWEIRIVYKEAGSQTNDWVNSCGFFQIYLGEITVTENEDNSLSYAITKQLITGGFSVFDGNITQSFKAYFSLENYPDDGDILDDDLLPDSITVNPGKVYLGDSVFPLPKTVFQLDLQSNDRYYILKINSRANTVELGSVEVNSYQYTTDKITFNIPICRVIQNGASRVGIQQYIDCDFVFSIDDKKVLLNRYDEVAGYLQEKIKYPVKSYSSLTPDESSIYTSNHQYMKGITKVEIVSATISGGSNTITMSNYSDELFWDYASIANFNASSGTASNANIQQLNNIDGELKWDNAYMVRVTDADNDPDFLDAKIQPGQFIYKAVDSSGNKLKIWTRGILAGYNIHCSAGYLNDDPQQPYTRIDGHKAVVVAGSGIDIDVTTTDSGYTKTYQVKFDHDVLANLIVSSDDSIDVTWSSTNHQYNLKDKGKIRVNANDTMGYLPSKLDSDNDSITINPSSSYVSLEINPDYFQSELDSISIIERNDYLALDINTDFFQSSDDSIEISYNGDYLDFTATGKVRCTMFDDLDYLNTKINVDSSIASLIRLIKNAGEIKIANALQGTGLIAISNGNITVLPAPAGNAVLACSNGVFTWLPYADCDFACQGSSSAE